MKRKPNRRRDVISVTLDPRSIQKLAELKDLWGHTYATQTVEKLVCDAHEKMTERRNGIASGDNAGGPSPASTNAQLNDRYYETAASSARAGRSGRARQ